MSKPAARLTIAIASAAVMLGVAGCATTLVEDETTRDEDGEVIEGGEVGALNIRVGDCLPEQTEGEFLTVQVVPCSEPHASEAYHAFDLPDGDYPGEESIFEQAEQGCFDAFEAFIGAPYATSIYDFSYLYPLEESWVAVSDREVLCAVFLVDGSLATGSAEGIGE